jgi:hypothetical protein
VAHEGPRGEVGGVEEQRALKIEHGALMKAFHGVVISLKTIRKRKLRVLLKSSPNKSLPSIKYIIANNDVSQRRIWHSLKKDLQQHKTSVKMTSTATAGAAELPIFFELQDL